jgi:cytochrome c oxidase assembly protein subunit 15
MTMDRRALVPLGFAISVGMWAIGYVCRLPFVTVPGALLLLLLLGSVLAGGYAAGRFAGGWPAGAAAAAIASTLNLLVLGSLLSGDRPGIIVPSALWWIPGSIVACAALGALGGVLGSRASRPDAVRPDWTAVFANVALAATFLLVTVGGLVTSADAGLAVVDWPNSYGYNMFLYPLSRMTGGIYYEHAHRLLGSLVGLTTLTLAVRLLRIEPRAWVRVLGVAAFVLVVTQGVLGGLRVTGEFTLSDSEAATSPNVNLAVVHGVLGQVFLATMMGLALVTSRTWKEARAGASTGAASDRILAVSVVLLLLVQLALGALLRHLDRVLVTHAALGGMLLPLAVIAGVRALDPSPEAAPRRRAGWALIGLAFGQVFLGIGALVATRLLDPGPAPGPVALTLATAHQTTGAALLAASVALALWTFRDRFVQRSASSSAERVVISGTSVAPASRMTLS